MSIAACAEITRGRDPDRFLSAMVAPPDDRAALFVLYAFNLEIARAPWVAHEPLAAEMRLQFWADLIGDMGKGRAADALVPGHEVAIPLGEVVRARNLPLAPLAGMIEARRFDIWRAPHADEAAVLAYVDATAGNLMWLAARALDMPEDGEALVRDFALGAGLAALLRALPALDAAGRNPLPMGDEAALRRLAERGLEGLRKARRQRRRVPARVRPALLAGWQADHVLRKVLRRPGAVMADGLAPSEFVRRAGLLARSMSGRW